MKTYYQNKPITESSKFEIFLNLVVGFIFVLLLLFIKPFKSVYLAPLKTSRIGHFILDTEILLARIHNDQFKSRRKIHVIWIPDKFISNNYVYNIYSDVIYIIKNCFLTHSIMQTAIYFEKLTKIRFTYRFIGWDGYLQYVHLLNQAPTVFRMPEKDIFECISDLQRNNIDVEKKWVCILARDNQYLKETQPELNWDYNSYRNSDIDTYKLAAEFLTERSILVFRMGSNVEKNFTIEKNNLIIDYANCSWRSEKLDIYLATKCLFFISTATGLDSVPVATRSPLLWVNLAQPLHVYRSKENFKFITKYFYLSENKKHLTPKDYYELGLKEGFTVDNPLHFRSQDLRRLGVEVVNNSSLEIKEATIEMYEFLKLKYDKKMTLSENQIKYWKSFPKDQRLDNFGEPRGGICERFLENNPWLSE
jgi:putative glycosyltransferase (TIGR04372 family)